MTWVVTETFIDWDGQKITKGTIADELVARGWGNGGKQFWNLIAGNRVLAVLNRRPPVELVEGFPE